MGNPATAAPRSKGCSPRKTKAWNSWNSSSPSRSWSLSWGMWHDEKKVCAESTCRLGLCVNIYIYLYLSIHMYIYIYLYLSIHIYIYTPIYIYPYIYICIDNYTCIDLYIYKYYIHTVITYLRIFWKKTVGGIPQFYPIPSTSFFSDVAAFGRQNLSMVYTELTANLRETIS